VDAGTDLEVIQHLDFEPTIGCEVKRPRPCPATATHILRCRGCAWSLAACAEHVAFIKSEVARCGGAICTKCKLSSIRITDVIDIVPIGGAL
jgi:hypothetical protein